MSLAYFLWLFCFAQCVMSSDFIGEYEAYTNKLFPQDNRDEVLPIVLGKDTSSGCICRATMHYKIVECFGNYECKQFPKVFYYIYRKASPEKRPEPNSETLWVVEEKEK